MRSREDHSTPHACSGLRVRRCSGALRGFISVPTVPMKQWIAKLLGLTRSQPKKEKDLPCVYSVAEENVRVDVLEHVLPCGHNAYSIYGEFYVEKLQKWFTIVDLRDYNVETAIKLLQKAAKFTA